MAKRLFITGTDTGVGKTWVTACLASLFLTQGQRVTVFKPVQTGVNSLEETDPAQIAQWLGPETVGFQWHCGVWVQPPAAPSVAVPAGLLNLSKIITQADPMVEDCDVLLVEGAGGALVPLNRYWSMADLIRRLQTQAIVVTRPNLGTINHTLLTVEALQKRGIPVCGIVINEAQPISDPERHSLAVQTVVSELTQWLPAIRLMGWLPFSQQTGEGCLAPFSNQAHAIVSILNCNGI